MNFVILHWMGKDISDVEQLQKYKIYGLPDSYTIPDSEFGETILGLMENFDVMLSQEGLATIKLDDKNGGFRHR